MSQHQHPHSSISKQPPPSPQRFQKQKLDSQFKKFLDMLKQLHINIPLVEALEQIPNYVKFMKDVLTRKRRLGEFETVAFTKECSSFLQIKLPSKMKDLGSFTIPCTIGNSYCGMALCDLGASINLMPMSMYRQLGISEVRPTTVNLQLADRSLAYPDGKIEDVLVKVDKFIFPADFIVLDYEANREIPIILGRPSLATGRTFINVQKGELTMRVQDEQVTFNVFKAMRFPDEVEECFVVSVVDSLASREFDTSNVGDPLERLLLFDSHNEDDEEKYLAWLEANILLEDSEKGYVEGQRRLNSIMKEVVQKEIIKWLDAGIIYPISDSSWVSPVQCIPKKGGITVMKNEDNELIPTRTIVVAPEDQHKTTFTFPYGTFAFRIIPFGLCNASAMFQRCMMAIFTDMVEQFLEVFLDDFSVFGDSYDACLIILSKVSKQGIEVDKAKIEDIEKLPPPNSVKNIRSFLGNVGFYRSRTLTEAQLNYTVTEKEILAIVFAFDKFCTYLVGTKVIVYTDHSAIKYLISRKDAKPRLIRWVLLLQEFDVEIQDRKGVENQVADHLSRMEREEDSNSLVPIKETFPDE
ncbi:uncharacterized protein LOC133829548 [Humulus lupulus]|uniref:uncharacterized protein LOC133829548 n=1 Tax=Humulus lupulus TaxID=3486 RepID=UPI002B4166B2|nr:uncharacterized protein LOC133829548 [Humulus lupulus]